MRDARAGGNAPSTGFSQDDRRPDIGHAVETKTNYSSCFRHAGRKCAGPAADSRNKCPARVGRNLRRGRADAHQLVVAVIVPLVRSLDLAPVGDAGWRLARHGDPPARDRQLAEEPPPRQPRALRVASGRCGRGACTMRAKSSTGRVRTCIARGSSGAPGERPAHGQHPAARRHGTGPRRGGGGAVRAGMADLPQARRQRLRVPPRGLRHAAPACWPQIAAAVPVPRPRLRRRARGGRARCGARRSRTTTASTCRGRR